MIVMEYVAGAGSGGCWLAVGEAVPVIGAVSAAFDRVDGRGIVHRALTPAIILRGPRRPRSRAAVTLGIQAASRRQEGCHHAGISTSCAQIGRDRRGRGESCRQAGERPWRPRTRPDGNKR